MKGMDISHYQGNVDFGKVKNAGIEICYIKATEGITYNDPKMMEYYNGAKAAGLKIGFYHYLRANNPIEEAQHFLNIVEGLQIDCKHVIDVEEVLGQTRAKISSNVRQFADYLISKGKEVCIYTGDSFFANNLDSTVKNIPLWVAHYGVSKPNATGWVGFQYTSDGSVNGIGGRVDLDDFTPGILLNSAQVYQSTPKPINNDVLKLQQILNKFKVHDDKGNTLVEDGIMGTRTETAVKRFQNLMGLQVDGVAGPNTWGAINQILAKPYDTLESPHLEYASRYIQWRVGTQIDGTFGRNTQAAVAIWQDKNGLKNDGKVGNLTWSKLIG